MKLAIVLLNWNGKDWLRKFLPILLINSKPYDIFVVDNCSSDDSVAFLQTHFPEVKIIQNKENYGFAKGYNEGLKKIDASYYCLLNTDVEVCHNWIAPCLDLLEKKTSIAAVQPKIKDFYRKDYFEFAGAAGGQLDNLGYPYARGRVFDKLEKDLGQYEKETPIFWASGCCLFVRSHDFWSVSGFDTRFFAHQEEIDLCWRLQNSGKEIWYTHKSEVFHVGGATLHKSNPNKTYLNFRNNLSMLVKNLPTKQLFWVLPLRLCLDGVASLQLAKTLSFSHLKAVFMAHMSFYRMLMGSIKQRQKRQIPHYYQTKFLVFRHFLQPKNKKQP